MTVLFVIKLLIVIKISFFCEFLRCGKASGLIRGSLFHIKGKKQFLKDPCVYFYY